jgi:predicted transcriptional regulator of viral defense system
MAHMSIGCRKAHDSDGDSYKRSEDRAVAELARRQHGVVSRAQLAEIGLHRGAIELRVARGRLHAVHSRVYAVGHTCLTDQGRWMAAVLAGGAGAALSHRSAAALWGIRPWGSTRAEVTAAARRESRLGVRFYCSHLPTDETTVHNGIPVTTVARTLFDLAGAVSRPQFERAVNEAEIRRLWDALSLADLLERHPRRPGAATIKNVIAAGARITRSDLEDLFTAFRKAADLPPAETNLVLYIGGRWIEADCVWREQRLIVELDSHTYHGTRASFESDRTRDRALTAAGWRVIRVTWRQLRDEPGALAEDLRAALALGPVANLPQA